MKENQKRPSKTRMMLKLILNLKISRNLELKDKIRERQQRK